MAQHSSATTTYITLTSALVARGYTEPKDDAPISRAWHLHMAQAYQDLADMRKLRRVERPDLVAEAEATARMHRTAANR